MACLDPSNTVQQVSSYPRPTSFPGPQQLRILPQYCFRGSCYAHTTLFEDVAFTVSPSDPETSQYSGGYMLVLRNVDRLCEHTIDPSCLDTASPDDCVAALTDRFNQSSGRRVPLAVPVAVGTWLE